MTSHCRVRVPHPFAVCAKGWEPQTFESSVRGTHPWRVAHMPAVTTISDNRALGAPFSRVLCEKWGVVVIRHRQQGTAALLVLNAKNLEAVFTMRRLFGVNE
jgi:hypothetical protein